MRRLLVLGSSGYVADPTPSIPAVFGSDTFTGASGTLLQNRTPDVGGTWVKHSISTADVGITTDNRVKDQTNNLGVYYVSDDPADADYSVFVTVYCYTNAGTGDVGCAGRIDTASSTYYSFRALRGSGVFQLNRMVNGSNTFMANSSAVTFVDGTSYVLELRMIGSAITGHVDGVQRVSATSAHIAGPGKAGIYVASTISNTTGLHGDTFEARN